MRRKYDFFFVCCENWTNFTPENTKSGVTPAFVKFRKLGPIDRDRSGFDNYYFLLSSLSGYHFTWVVVF